MTGPVADTLLATEHSQNFHVLGFDFLVRLDATLLDGQTVSFALQNHRPNPTPGLRPDLLSFLPRQRTLHHKLLHGQVIQLADVAGTLRPEPARKCQPPLMG